MDLLKTVKKFIQGSSGPFLLGYSGGPDSKALLHALLACGIRPHIAHVDHGWREESAQESSLLEEEAKELGLPFHSIRLQERPEKNLEEYAREARIRFFKSLFEKVPFQALLIAHHADDLAETSLKRLFEGAHLPSLGGMAPRSMNGSMPIWRPFLTIRKKEILTFLENASISSFHDRTNDDPKFLRTRLRKTLIPQLSESFGKEVVSNLTLLSERAYELKEYLDKKVLSIPKIEGEWGVAFDLKNVEKLESRHLLKDHIRSRNTIEKVLIAKRGSFSPNIWVEKGWVVILRESKRLTHSEMKNVLGQFNIFLL